MPNFRILLIEDSVADQILFINQAQNDAGMDVTVDCAVDLSGAFALLERATEVPYDQIWLDPGLPGLDRSQVGNVLVQLKRYVEPRELRILTSTASPEVSQQAKQQNVELLHKDILSDSNSGLLEILRSLAVRRSSGATQKVELGKHELRLLYVEGAIGKFEGSLKEFNERLRQFDETALQVRLLADLMNQFPSFKESLSKVEKAIDKEAQAVARQSEMKKSFLQYVFPTLLTAGTAIATLLLTQYFSANKPQTPTAPPVVSPTTKQ